MVNGGDSLIFEVLDELRIALPACVAERVLPRLRPDFMSKS